jgi:folate-binding protein YgfZ
MTDHAPAPLTAAHLVDRGVIRVAGADRVAFLQGLVSNDVMKVGPAATVYACLLTPQGKFLHDFFLVDADDALLLECDGGRRDDLIRRLAAYRLRSKVEIADATDRFAVFALFGDLAASRLVGGPAAGAERGFAGGIVYDDPRLPALGSRVLLPKPADAAALKSAGAVVGDAADYDRHRIGLGVPDGGRDMEVGKAILLENDIDLLNGISWDKGCYMGQELTARTRYRGLVKKRLVPVAISGEAPALGTPLIEAGREVGEMRSSAADLGLALLRLDRLREARPIALDSATLTPRPPAWLAPALTETESA